MSGRRRTHRTTAGAVVACASMIGAVALAPPAQAAPPGVTVTLSGVVLTVTGDAAANSLVVGRTPAGALTLNGDPVLGGTATVTSVLDVVMQGGGGNDTLRIDESTGPMPRIEFLGGDGNDTLDGGSRADSLLGGPGADAIAGKGGDDSLIGDAGNDKVIGGPGKDAVTLGTDSDEFTWNPGDGDDRVDADAGKDTLKFSGGAAEDLVNLLPDGPRVRVFSPPLSDIHGSVDVNVRGFELMNITMADVPLTSVRVNDLPGAGVGVVHVKFASPEDSRVLFRGTLGPDRIRIAGTADTGVTVFGLSETVLIDDTRGLTVTGGDGDDVIDAGGLAAGRVDLEEFGGQAPVNSTGTDGADTLIGTPGDDFLSGGTGIDRIDGRGGNDLIVDN
jgi:Ca2+-binding RTX toxin-like protein